MINETEESIFQTLETLDLIKTYIDAAIVNNATASAWDDVIDGMKLLFDIYTGNTGLPPPNNPQLPQLPDA